MEDANASLAVKPDLTQGVAGKGPATKGWATRQELMRGAQRVFARLGYMNAEIRHFTEEAGKSTGTFYIYFDSKADLLRALLDDFLTDLRSPEGLGFPDNPPEQIRHVLTVIWETYSRHAATFRAVVDAAAKYAEFGQAYDQARAYAIRDFAQMVRVRQAAGACRHLDAGLAGFAMSLMLEQWMYEWLAKPHDTSDERALKSRAFDTIASMMESILEIRSAD